MNDDCIIKICSYLNYVDLANLFQTSKRFNKPINCVIKTNEYSFVFSDKTKRNEEKKNISNFLKLFGNQVKRLKIKFEPFAYDKKSVLFLEHQIKENCAPGMITHFSYDKFQFSANFFRLNANLFRSVNKLHFERASHKEHLQEILDTCTSLKEIEFIDFTNEMYLLIPRFFSLNLKKFLNCCFNYLSAIDLENIPINHTINDLNIQCENNANAVNLLKKVPNLTTLQICANDDGLLVLATEINNSQIQNLTLYCEYCTKKGIERFLSKIEEDKLIELNLAHVLHKENYSSNNIISKLNKMNNLKKLSICAQLAINENYLNTTQNLGLLTSFGLQFTWPDQINEKRIQNILNVLKNRKTINHLNLQLPSSATNFVDIKFFNALTNIRQNQRNKFILYVKIYIEWHTANYMSEKNKLRKCVSNAFVHMEIFKEYWN